MVDYLAVGVCPKCRIVNIADLEVAKSGFLPRDATVDITCALCDSTYSLKSSEVTYWCSE